MNIRRNYQTACPACRARTGQPCTGKQGERLPGVHFQRTAALRTASLAAFKALYAPLTTLSICLALCCVTAFAQSTPPTTAPQTPSVANYSIMLVNPGNGGGVVIMHNPQNILELVDASKIQAALSGGYVPVRAAELAELIASFKEDIARLSDENKRLKADQAKQVSNNPSLLTPEEQESRRSAERVSEMRTQADIEAQRRAQIAAEQSARRAQIIQAWGMMQAMQPAPYRNPMPTPMRGASTSNPTQTNCTTQYVGTTAYTSCN